MKEETARDAEQRQAQRAYYRQMIRTIRSNNAVIDYVLEAAAYNHHTLIRVVPRPFSPYVTTYRCVGCGASVSPHHHDRTISVIDPRLIDDDCSQALFLAVGIVDTPPREDHPQNERAGDEESRLLGKIAYDTFHTGLYFTSAPWEKLTDESKLPWIEIARAIRAVLSSPPSPPPHLVHQETCLRCGQKIITAHWIAHRSTDGARGYVCTNCAEALR